MPNLAVRDIDPEHYQALIDEAADNGRSLAAEVRSFAADVARRRMGKKVVAELKALRERHPIRLAPGEDAVSLIRAVRDEE